MKYFYQTVTAATLQPSTELATCMISTITPDREGDVVVPEGGNFANFMKSPVLMWAHGGTDGYASVPIGSVTALEVMPGHGVKAEWKWLEGDPFADRIKNAWQQGVVRASSIGFKPLTYQKNGMGNDIQTWELLELSLCAIPMNPEAVRSLKALGLMDGTEVLRMADNKEELDAVEQDEESEGPQPTPSVPPESDMVADSEDKEVENAGQKEHGAAMQAISALLTQLTALVAEMQSEGDDTEDSGEEVEIELDSMHDEEKSVPKSTKSGRVLSSKNELKIKAARAHLDDVMKSIYKMPMDGKPSAMPVSKSMDAIVMNIIDDAVAEPTFRIDPETMRSAIADAVKSAITVPAMESFQRAINLARGRVH